MTYKISRIVRKLGDSKFLTIPQEFTGIEIGTVLSLRQEGNKIIMVPLVEME